MKYRNEVTINLPRERTVELFDNSENLKKWQPSLKDSIHLEGEVGRTGAKTLLVYEERGKDVEMTETIIKRDLPDVFVAKYEAKGVKNINHNHFHIENEQATRWIMTNEFRFSGFMAIASMFMRKAFPKQTLKEMNNFKDFAENAQ
ncbi:MAG: hypothetical protein HeimAB125_09410 [Candidatus Heimdallarchaeota archaeon AB_125]|nr:MAG: hypothetical protein HeimAB125_09410 [Candidatus Heimdallarchaeota archaeon AB_125]